MNEENLNKLNKIAHDENITFLNITDKTTTKNKIRFRCNICGTEKECNYSTITDSRRVNGICTRCYAEKRFLKRLDELYGRNPYDFISRFEGFDRHLIVKCKDCGFEFEEKRAGALLLNSRLAEGIHPCKGCTKQRQYNSKNIKELEDVLIQKFGSCDYIFPEPEKYNGLFSKEKFKIICKRCCHEMNTVLINILNPSNGNHYCRVCNNKNRLLETMSYKERCLKVTDGKIEPIEDYIDSRIPISHKCNICGYGSDGSWKKIPVKNTTRNAGCPICANNSTVSKAENEIEDFIKSIAPELKIIRNTRSILSSKKELDIYIPEKRVAIEHHGLYWHSDKHKDKNAHIDKLKECEKEGIILLQIFEDEWINKKNIVKLVVQTVLDIGESVSHLECEISNISENDKNIFLNNFHLNGNDNSAISKCLKYNNEIVALMTIAYDNNKYKISRYAYSKNIINGFDVLFKSIIEEFNISEIYKDVDLRFINEKNICEQSGFIEETIFHPRYFYFNRNKRPLQREILDENIVINDNYVRLWDAGHVMMKWYK